MKDMGEASYVIGIGIFHDRSQRLLGLSHKAYINRVLEKFTMEKCSPSIVPIQKGDKLNLMQCPKNDMERMEMDKICSALFLVQLDWWIRTRSGML